MPNAGNFGVFPGSHRALARAIDAAGGPSAAAAVLGAQDGRSATQHLQSLLPLATLAPPHPLCVQAGAAYLAHYQTLHFVQPNVVGTAPRVAVYFRVTHPQRAVALPVGADPCTRLEALGSSGLFSELPGLVGLPA